MDFSIVITTRNRKKELLKCVESVKKSRLDDLAWELIVVDDFSSDGTEALHASDLNVANGKIIHNPSQQMLVRSRNIGARRSKGKYILFIDDDNVVAPEMIFNILDFTKRHKKVGIAGPSMYYQDTREKSMDFQKINLFTGKTNFLFCQTEKEFCRSDGLPNAFLVKQEVFEKAGYFDESLIQTFTEPDFALRAKKIGYDCTVVVKAKIFHNISRAKKFEPDSLGGNFPQKAYCVMRNRTVFVCRYGNLLQKFSYILFFSWLWPLLYSMIVLRRKRIDLVKIYWRGWLDGVIYFFTGRLINSLPKLLK